MADRRDDLDAWLGERIDPLPPPPGTFDLIRRRARRRKLRTLAITATSAAAIVAAAVTVPQVVSLPVLSPNPTTSAVAGQSTAAPAPSGPGVPSTAAPSTAANSAAPEPPVPPHFRPGSVTFVGTLTGWVIGQAGSPGHCATRYCTSLARTDDAGRTWTGVPAPRAGLPDGAAGVSQVRFLNLADGWAFGPELFATHDGGRTWAQVDTGGLRVTGLETVGSRVFALWASCTGTGQAFAAFCTAFTLYSSPAAGDDWAPVGAATTGLTSGNAGGAASLALTGSRGYLLAPDGTLYAGPVDGTAAWTRAGSLTSSCSVGTALPSGQPSGALLGAAGASELIVACTSPGKPGNGDVEAKHVFSSPDGGVSWLALGTAPAAGTAYSLAASPRESVVLATDEGIELLPSGEIAWRMATLAAAMPPGGFGFVGMTTDEQGVALPADPASGTVWFTFDGGQTWQPSRLNGS